MECYVSEDSPAARGVNPDTQQNGNVSERTPFLCSYGYLDNTSTWQPDQDYDKVSDHQTPLNPNSRQFLSGGVPRGTKAANIVQDYRGDSGDYITDSGASSEYNDQQECRESNGDYGVEDSDYYIEGDNVDISTEYMNSPSHCTRYGDTREFRNIPSRYIRETHNDNPDDYLHDRPSPTQYRGSPREYSSNRNRKPRDRAHEHRHTDSEYTNNTEDICRTDPGQSSVTAQYQLPRDAHGNLATSGAHNGQYTSQRGINSDQLTSGDNPYTLQRDMNVNQSSPSEYTISCLSYYDPYHDTTYAAHYLIPLKPLLGGAADEDYDTSGSLSGVSVPVVSPGAIRTSQTPGNGHQESRDASGDNNVRSGDTSEMRIQPRNLSHGQNSGSRDKLINDQSQDVSHDQYNRRASTPRDGVCYRHSDGERAIIEYASASTGYTAVNLDEYQDIRRDVYSHCSDTVDDRSIRDAYVINHGGTSPHHHEASGYPHSMTSSGYTQVTQSLDVPSMTGVPSGYTPVLTTMGGRLPGVFPKDPLAAVIQNSLNPSWKVDYMDFTPELSGFEHGSLYCTQTFPDIMKRVNFWLRQNPQVEVNTCEMMTWCTSQLPQVGDSESMIQDKHCEKSPGTDSYNVMGVRLWLVPRLCPGAPQTLGYRDYKAYEGERLSQLTQKANTHLEEHPLDGSLISFETVMVPGARSWDMDSLYWRDKQAGIAGLFNVFLRLFYVHGTKTQHRLGIRNIVPEVIRGNHHEPFSLLMRRASQWVSGEPGVKVTNLRSTYVSKDDGDTALLAAEQCQQYFRDFTKQSYFQLLRIYYTCSPSNVTSEHNKQNISCMTFTPVQASLGSNVLATFERMKPTMLRIGAWIRLSGANIFSMESIVTPLLPSQPNHTLPEMTHWTPAQSITMEANRKFLIHIRIYIDGEFMDPDPRLLPPLPYSLTKELQNSIEEKELKRFYKKKKMRKTQNRIAIATFMFILVTVALVIIIERMLKKYYQ